MTEEEIAAKFHESLDEGTHPELDGTVVRTDDGSIEVKRCQSPDKGFVATITTSDGVVYTYHSACHDRPEDAFVPFVVGDVESRNIGFHFITKEK